jgi:hypothetical protein
MSCTSSLAARRSLAAQRRIWQHADDRGAAQILAFGRQFPKRRSSTGFRPPAVEYRNIFYGPGDDGVVSGEFALWSLGQRGEARGRTRRLRFSAPRIAASASHRSPPRKAAADTGSGGGPVSSLGSRAARRRAQLRDLRDTALAEMAKPEARPALRPTRRRYRRVKNRETGKTGKQCCRSVRRGAADNAGNPWCRRLHWLGSRDILPASPEVRQNSAPSCILDLPSGPH